MATSRIILPVAPSGGAVVLPTSNPAVVSSLQASTASVTTNTPAVSWYRLEFDQSTDQTAAWNFRVPSDWLSGMTIVIKWAAAVASGNVVWKAGLSIDTDGSTDHRARTYVAGDLSSVVAAPTTLGQTKETSWALTTTGLTAGMLVSIFLGRDADNGSDTTAGTSYVLAAELNYSS